MSKYLEKYLWETSFSIKISALQPSSCKFSKKWTLLQVVFKDQAQLLRKNFLKKLSEKQ